MSIQTNRECRIQLAKSSLVLKEIYTDTSTNKISNVYSLSMQYSFKSRGTNLENMIHS